MLQLGKTHFLDIAVESVLPSGWENSEFKYYATPKSSNVFENISCQRAVC